MYRLEEGVWGENWTEIDEDENFESLVSTADNEDSMGGKYQFRIVDDDDDVIWTAYSPYEVLRINVCDLSFMEDLCDNYGIDDSIWKAACEEWLRRHDG